MFEERRNHMVARLNAIDGIHCDMPDGAFYVFASVAGLIGLSMPDGKPFQTDVDVAEWPRSLPRGRKQWCSSWGASCVLTN
ncbi:MAG: hypothetical protein QM625_04725 [Ralstonia sp.]|uniref:Uncharacterized protein n=1 Tax=Ralstonia pickettii TaxID=329 RepID=A0AAW4QE07_RALPI|nr:hypothetical protein [Ralstonia pickettii]MBA9884933.1 hypothetical protein [Ralstonia pickettii]MBA9889922.1 hypothetical protein [Ralstonia pickettii]MBA9926750.1 hypothetical protein [Ralstonia pickettii]MBA9966047.1 hypothetical protein [Ralstonia pickettii]MBA9990311.1 hypothetical protein [Ralstonia pickettii]